MGDRYMELYVTSMGGTVMRNLKKHWTFICLFVLFSLLTIGVLQWMGFFLFTDDLAKEIIRDTSIRIGVTNFFMVLLTYLGFRLFQRPLLSWMGVSIVMIPGLIIAINNFPISAYLAQRAIITQPVHGVWLYAIECGSIGLMEEILFRGVILVVLMQHFPKNRAGYFAAILASSAIFGLVHLLNLFAGASFHDTLLQVGYSFLMGCLWAVVYLATRNLVFSMVLHALYNFCGSVMFRMGTVVDRFDAITTVITVVLALAAILFYLVVFRRLKKATLESIYVLMPEAGK
jgi:membrane protease YdiL (CAAX protease family)